VNHTSQRTDDSRKSKMTKPVMMRLRIPLTAFLAVNCSSNKKDDKAVSAVPTATPTVKETEEENIHCCDFLQLRQEYSFSKSTAVAKVETDCKWFGAIWYTGKCSRNSVTFGCKLAEDPKGVTTTIWRTTSLKDPSPCIDGQTKVNP
jgi:hypothetical protein